MNGSLLNSDTAEKSTSYLRIAQLLRREIVDGTLQSGARLKTQELSKRYGVSPQPIREALQLLQGEGLIVIEPNRGASVRGLNMDRLRHIYELREAIEAALTRRFAEEAALSDIRRLEMIQSLHDTAVAERDIVAADKANYEFHAVIVEHSGNEEAIMLRDRYFGLSASLRRRFGFMPNRWETAQRDHREMLDAFRQRDGMLAYAIASAHVRMTMQELFARIEGDDLSAALRKISIPAQSAAHS